MDKTDCLYQDIKSLKIQGATNVALAVLEGIRISSQGGANLQEAALRLAYARPTEPLAQNAVRFIFDKKGQLPDYYLRRAQEYQKMIEKAKDEMGTVGTKLIKNGGVYLTHCHSSTVTSMFIKAKKERENFSVFATETRPMFQGRITAKELLEAGIEATLIIDDAAISLLEGQQKQIEAVFIGADLLTDKGFVNKVGSLGLACAAKRNRTPFYSLSILLKYDPRPFSKELIEQRNPDEIWKEAPQNLKIYAPAFDFVPYDTGVKIISEKGIIEGKDIANKARELYPFIK